MDAAGLAALLAAIARHTPPLVGARCREPHTRAIFDEAQNTRSAAASRAVSVYNSCPALQQCRLWVDTLGADPRLRGVVAGRRITARPRPRSA